MTVRVVIADDHPMFRFGLAAVLNASPEVEVVGEASDGTELVSLVERTRPTVALTDLAMPGLDGTTAAQQIANRFPDTNVVVLTMHDDEDAIAGALRAGARGYLLKGADADEIVSAVLAVRGGNAIYSAAVANRLITRFTTTTPDAAKCAFPELTSRECEILELVATGIGNHEIAHRLCLSEKTVRNNLATILTKLQLPTRAAAIARARDAGLGRT